MPHRLSIVFLLLFLAPLAAVSEGPPTSTEALPAETLAHAGDYTFGYYPYGWRGLAPNGQSIFAVQTNHYGLWLNTSGARIERFAPLADAPDALEAATSASDWRDRLPEWGLSFSIETPSGAYPAAHIAPSRYSNRRPNIGLIRQFHNGKYLQHFDLRTLVFRKVKLGGELTGVQGWLEFFCWPDRLGLMLNVLCDPNQMVSSSIFQEAKLAAKWPVPEGFAALAPTGEGGAWQALHPGEISTGGIALRNGTQGVALLPAHPGDLRISLREDGRMIQIRTRKPLVPGALHSLKLVLVPLSEGDLRAAIQENRQLRSPLETARIQAAALAPYDGPCQVLYEPTQGWYKVLLGDCGDPNTVERIRVELTNPIQAPQTVRLNFAKEDKSMAITGMSPVLRDGQGLPIGLPVQISKNWHVSPSWFHGLAMLELAPLQSLELEFTLAYAKWGTVPAASHAQLCLVGYDIYQLWDEMAIGSFGESICYDPDVNLRRSMIDDVRPLMVWAMGPQPQRKWSWTHNVGGGDFLALFKKDDPDRVFLAGQKTLYASCGPVLTNVLYAGQTPGGTIRTAIRTQSWRSDDYVRALYTLRYDVVKRMDDIDRLAFFQLGADHYNTNPIETISRGAIEGLDETWTPPRGGWTYSRRGLPLEGEMPWFAFSSPGKPARISENDQGAWANRGMILRNWRARLGGQEDIGPAYSIYGTEDGLPSALIELSPPASLTALEPGDFVEAQVEMLVLPQQAGDYYGPNERFRAFLSEHPEAWQLAHREALEADLAIKAAKGTVERLWPLRIKADKGRRAEFTVRGGLGYTPITITGAANHGPFTLERIVDGQAELIDQSAIGNDWWQATYDAENGSWDLSFTLDLDPRAGEAPEQTFIWALLPE